MLWQLQCNLQIPEPLEENQKEHQGILVVKPTLPAYVQNALYSYKQPQLPQQPLGQLLVPFELPYWLAVFQLLQCQLRY
jgi:hypothetical protein